MNFSELLQRRAAAECGGDFHGNLGGPDEGGRRRRLRRRVRRRSAALAGGRRLVRARPRRKSGTTAARRSGHRAAARWLHWKRNFIPQTIFFSIVQWILRFWLQIQRESEKKGIPQCKMFATFVDRLAFLVFGVVYLVLLLALVP